MQDSSKHGFVDWELLKTRRTGEGVKARLDSKFYKYLILLANLDPGPAQPLWLYAGETILRFLEVPSSASQNAVATQLTENNNIVI